jgi:hypothetical protein
MTRTRHGGRGGFTPVDAVFGVLGFIVGLGAVLYGYTLIPSLALAIFVFVVVSHLVGRALPDVITEDRKVQRAAYFALLPTVGTAALYASYLLWDGMWLAVILGFVAGGIAQTLLGRTLFPQVRKEEGAEERDRAGIRPEEWREPGPNDLVYRGNGWYLGPDDLGYRWYRWWRRRHYATDARNRGER